MKKSKIQPFRRITNPQFKFLATIAVTITGLLLNHISCHRPHLSYTTSEEHIETCFTPEEPCLDLILSKILSAKETILVQAYVITSQKIVDSLIKAHQQKIKVQLLVDKGAQASYGSKIDLILKSGIPVIIDKTAGIAHNKVMIIDDEYVITGSFNWTNGAQTRNSENVVIIKGKDNCKRFKDNWYRRAEAGERLKRKNQNGYK
jgi:phospholipase D